MNSNDINIDVLLKLFSKLSLILINNRTDDIEVQISDVNYIVRILEECKKNNYNNSNDIINDIKKIYKNLYPARGGLTDFFIWKTDFDERIKANEPLDKISDELWKLLK